MKRLYTASLILSAFMLIWAPEIFAHYTSITVDNYNPEQHAEITINIGWGHKFPGDGEPRREAYDKMNLKIIDPTGREKSIPIVPKGERGNESVKVTLSDFGFYTIVLSKKNFSTKTTKGYKYQPKNELKDVVHSKWSETVSKAFVAVGSLGNGFGAGETDDRFQIIPLENPLKLKEGDTLPVKVTLDGNPWRGMVYSTYAEFSGAEDTFAYTTRTDKKGIAQIKILEDGLWLIKADHTYPYENTKRADEYSLKATLTFRCEGD